MADITYPNGVDGFQVIAATGTALTDTPTALGSIQLGTGNPVVGQRAALGVVFQFSVVANSDTSLAISFMVTNDDGVTWSSVSEYDFSLGSLADTNFRLHIQPFTFGATAVRVLASSSSPNTATIGIQARLTEIFGVVGGAIGS